MCAGVRPTGRSLLVSGIKGCWGAVGPQAKLGQGLNRVPTHDVWATRACRRAAPFAAQQACLVWACLAQAGPSARACTVCIGGPGLTRLRELRHPQLQRECCRLASATCWAASLAHAVRCSGLLYLCAAAVQSSSLALLRLWYV